ncbi:MAG: galactonate dehydratase [Bifidobacteriaceae bacterium]|jgi:galactonate dehydratase|nr:galactonate dehydratase [Bifidobacteriaceae bacterium]
MRITGYELFKVPPRWLFLAIHTDEGLTGWGEPVAEGHAETVQTAVEAMMEPLMGADPRLIEDHWQRGFRAGFYRGGPILCSAAAGIDQALWDIAGKAAGLPVHQMLGGAVRQQIRAYTWVGGDDPAELADAIGQRISQGATAVKMNLAGALDPLPSQAALEAMAARAAAAREALGPDRDFAVDCHGRVTPAAARNCARAVAPFRPLFVEEPVAPEFTALLGDLVRDIPVPVATGERLYSRWDFRLPLEAGVAVVQPDLSHAGGISECHRIASLAETFGALVAPHCPLGPIALAACLQLDAVTPNFLIQECSVGIHYNVGWDLLDYVLDKAVLDISTGYYQVPEGPGLGIEVDLAEVRKAAAKGHAWRTPVWRRADGALTEW